MEEEKSIIRKMINISSILYPSGTDVKLKSFFIVYSWNIGMWLTKQHG